MLSIHKPEREVEYLVPNGALSAHVSVSHPESGSVLLRVLGYFCPADPSVGFLFDRADISEVFLDDEEIEEPEKVFSDSALEKMEQALLDSMTEDYSP